MIHFNANAEGARGLKVEPTNTLANDMRLRFKSGNSVPVQRAHITAAEWAKIEELLATSSEVLSFAAAGASAYCDYEALTRFEAALENITGSWFEANRRKA